MNLYRADAPNAGPLTDLLGPCLMRRYRAACDSAQAYANRVREPVTLTRISGSGTLTRGRTFQPKGSQHE